LLHALVLTTIFFVLLKEPALSRLSVVPLKMAQADGMEWNGMENWSKIDALSKFRGPKTLL
jgi:hypothetical protein